MPAGSCTQREHSGGAGAPPGSTMRTCQELAWRFDFALPASGLLERKIQTEARPAAVIAVIGAPRGARRSPQGRADTTGLRFSARHPPHREEGHGPVSMDRGGTLPRVKSEGKL